MAEANSQTWVCQAWHCGEIYEGTDRWCPKCRNVSATQKSIRRRGIVLIVCGLFLVGMMATLTWFLAPLMLHPGEQQAGGSTFTGTQSDTMTIFGIFALVAVFGLGALVAGYIQLVYGRQNWKIVIIMLAVISVLFTVVWFIQNGFLLSNA